MQSFFHLLTFLLLVSGNNEFLIEEEEELVNQYLVNLTYHSPTPILSHANAKGQGASVCTDNFNPSWIPASAGLSSAGILFRANGCPSPPAPTNGEHISFVPCTLDGVCSDVDSTVILFEKGAEDPRAFFYNDFYYNFYYAPVNTSDPTCNSSQCSVKFAKTKTPLNASSWQHITTLPWHRNGCCTLPQSSTDLFYCIWGEGPDPFPGLGISTTKSLDNPVFTQIPWTFENGTTGEWLLPLGDDQNEIKLEAGTHPLRLSTGDWLHFYAAATPGWIPDGNYTAGWIILDKANPAKIIQRSIEHILIPTYPYEIGTAPYQGERNNVIFLCSATPTANKDEFRLFFGAADGHVGTAVVKVTLLTAP